MQLCFHFSANRRKMLFQTSHYEEQTYFSNFTSGLVLDMPEWLKPTFVSVACPWACLKPNFTPSMKLWIAPTVNDSALNGLRPTNAACQRFKLNLGLQAKAPLSSANKFGPTHNPTLNIVSIITNGRSENVVGLMPFSTYGALLKSISFKNIL